MMILKVPRFKQKKFSIHQFLNRSDLFKMLTKSGKMKELIDTVSDSITSIVIQSILNYLKDLNKREIQKLNIPSKNKELDNKFLEKTLQSLHYRKNNNYTIGERNSEICMSVLNGIFILTIPINSKDLEKIDEVWKKYKTEVMRNKSGRVIIFTNIIKNKTNFKYLINRLMSTGIVPNIYEG